MISRLLPLKSNFAIAHAAEDESGGRQRELGQIGAYILGRIEAGKMPAENLELRIALETLRTAVPTDDVPVGIEHVDGIVFDRIDQALKAINAHIFLGGVNIPDLAHQVPRRVPPHSYVVSAP